MGKRVSELVSTENGCISAQPVQKTENYRIYDKPRIRDNLLWTCCIFSTSAFDKSEKIFLSIYTWKCLHIVKFLFPVGSLQSHGSFIQQRKITLYCNILFNSYSYSLLCNGASKCNSDSNCSSSTGSGAPLVCDKLCSWRTDWSQILRQIVFWILQKLSEQEPPRVKM